MSAKLNDGGPAYPQLSVVSCERDGHGDLIDPFTSASGGMSLRDWFAGQALLRMPLVATGSQITKKGALEIASMAQTAYAIADAMLSARQNKEKGE